MLSKTKRLLFGLFLILVMPLAFSQQRVIWKIVWPGGTVLQFEYPNIEMCQNAIQSNPPGSTCVAFQK